MSGHDVIRTARLLCVLLLLGFLATPRAQIVITPDEVPQTPGDTFTYKYTTLLSPVNVGVQGGPQTWVFDTATFVGNFAACKLVDPAGTPLIQYYPLANICWQSAADTNVVAYQYMSVSASEYVDYGGGSVSPETVMYQVYDPFMTVHTLPLDYGSQWTTDWSWCDTMEDIIISMHTWGPAYVDAWGTAAMPFASIPCLRINSYDSTITMTWYRGSLINSDTFGIRTYRWYGENLSHLAVASGAEDDTSLIFTETNCYRVLVAAGFGIAEGRSARLPGSGIRVGPNPFARTASVPGRENERFTVYDLTGQQVGEYAGRAIGADLRAGVYFVRDGYNRGGTPVVKTR